MNEQIAHIADKTINKAKFVRETRYANGNTNNIIAEILAVDKISKNDTKEFAKHLIGSTKHETLNNVWNFIKHNIRYVIDPVGIQFIKTPSRIWADKYADCKGYSIFIGSILKNLALDFTYRFVSFSDNQIYTHVYIVCDGVILDAVMPEFNKEKPFNFKKNIHMTQIIRMSGIDNAGNQKLTKKVINLGNRDLGDMSSGELDLWIARDRFLTEKAIVDKIRGIGSLKAEKYQDSIDMLEDAIEAVQAHTMNGICGNSDDLLEELNTIAVQAVTGLYSNAKAIHGIGSIAGKKDERKNRKADRKAIRKEFKGKERKTKMQEWRAANGTKTGKFLQKVGQKIKKGLKAVGKFLSAPERAILKKIMENHLPKSAPMFLYLFITDPALIEKLPQASREKRKKAEKNAGIIMKGTGIDQNQFMGIVRNGIMKTMGDSPENIIAKQMKSISGVGSGIINDVANTAIKAAGGFLQKILDWIVKVFTKKKNKSPEEMQLLKDTIIAMSQKLIDESKPNPGSEEEKSEEVAAGVRNQPANTLNADNADDDPANDGKGGKSIWSSFGG